MKKITLWYRFKNGKFEYNHYEDGWDGLIKPVIIMNTSGRWAKEFAYMDGSTVKHLDKV